MPTIPAGFGQVNWQFEGVGAPQGAEVTLGVADAAVETPDNLALGFAAIFADNILPLLNDDVTLVNTHYKRGPSATGPTGDFATNDNGGQSGAGAPPNTAYLVRKNTAGGGRANRGRWYLPGVTEAEVNSSGSVLSTFVSTMNTALAAFLSDLDAAGITPVVLHGTESPVQVPTEITSLLMTGTAATQRNRLR